MIKRLPVRSSHFSLLASRTRSRQPALTGVPIPVEAVKGGATLVTAAQQTKSNKRSDSVANVVSVGEGEMVSPEQGVDGFVIRRGNDAGTSGNTSGRLSNAPAGVSRRFVAPRLPRFSGQALYDKTTGRLSAPSAERCLT